MISAANGASLIIGTASNSPPFSMKVAPGNQFAGFDIDLMDQICIRLNFTCTYKAFLFDDLLSAVQDGQINAAVGAVTITQERTRKYLFSLPYLASSVQFMANVATAINTPDDVKGKTIGVQAGTPFGDLVVSLYQKNVKIKYFSTTPDLLEALSKKIVDGIILDTNVARYWYANNSNIYKLVGPPIPFGDGYGIVVSPSNQFLVSDINRALLHMESDGTYLNLYSHYFGN